MIVLHPGNSCVDLLVAPPVAGMSPVAMAYRDARSSMLVWQYRSKNV